MGHLYAVVEHTGLSEHQVVLPNLVVLSGILAAVEPHQVHDARAVAEVGHDTLPSRPHLEGLETQNTPHDLHKGHVARQLADGVDLAAVNVLIGIALQQVTIGLDAEFLTQHLLAIGAYARQVHDVLR